MGLGLFFLVWTLWWPWAALVSLLWMFLAYALTLDAARVYADLFESTFDLYRWSLYEALKWERPPVSGAEEIKHGERLSEFLWRGTDGPPGG